MMKKSLSGFIAFVLVSVAPVSVFAQLEDNLEVGISDPLTEEDIGEIQPAREDALQSVMRITGQVQGEYTSNAKLQGDHGNSDVLWLPTVEVGYNVPLTRQFSLDVMAKAETVLYSDNFGLSFYGVTAAATLEYRHKVEYPRIYVGAEPYWYQGIESGDKLASAVNFVIGSDQGVPFNRGRSMIFWGYRFGASVSDPNDDARYAHRGIVGFTHQFRPLLYGQVYYSCQYSDYYNASRQDIRHVLGATLSYQWTDGMFTSLSAGFADNESDQDMASYQSATVGFAVTWQF